MATESDEFIVKKSSVMKIRQNVQKIQHLFDVQLELGEVYKDVYISTSAKKRIDKQWVKLKGMREDRNNAKEYIIGLCEPDDETTLSNKHLVKKISNNPEMLEHIERDTHAVIHYNPAHRSLHISGTDLAVTLALSIFEDISVEGDNDDACSDPSARSPGTASSRLDLVLERSLKQNSDGFSSSQDYINTPDSVKRVMVQCLSDVVKTHKLRQYDRTVSSKTNVSDASLACSVVGVAERLHASDSKCVSETNRAEDSGDVDINNSETQDGGESCGTEACGAEACSAERGVSEGSTPAEGGELLIQQRNQLEKLGKIFKYTDAEIQTALVDTRFLKTDHCPENFLRMLLGNKQRDSASMAADVMVIDSDSDVVCLDDSGAVSNPGITTAIEDMDHDRPFLEASVESALPLDETMAGELFYTSEGQTVNVTDVTMDEAAGLDANMEDTLACLWPPSVSDGNDTKEREYWMRLAKDFSEEGSSSSIEDLKERSLQRKEILERYLTERSRAKETTESLRTMGQESGRETSGDKKKKRRVRRRSKATVEPGRNIIDLTESLSMNTLDMNSDLEDVTILDESQDSDETMLMTVWTPSSTQTSDKDTGTCQTNKGDSNGARLSTSGQERCAGSINATQNVNVNNKIYHDSSKNKTACVDTDYTALGKHSKNTQKGAPSNKQNAINAKSRNYGQNCKKKKKEKVSSSTPVQKQKKTWQPLSLAPQNNSCVSKPKQKACVSMLPCSASASGSTPHFTSPFTKNPPSTSTSSSKHSVPNIPNTNFPQNSLPSHVQHNLNMILNDCALGMVSTLDVPSHVQHNLNVILNDCAPGMVSTLDVPSTTNITAVVPSYLQGEVSSFEAIPGDEGAVPMNTGFVPRSCLPPESYRVARPQRPRTRHRYIVVDGSNVAMAHGNNKVFSCYGIVVCLNYFLGRGHQEITVFVPQWRRRAPSHAYPISDQKLLENLATDGYLVFTPARRLDGRNISCYDDRYVLNLAVAHDAVVVSNDNYRDLVNEKAEFRRIISERLLMFSFVGDIFMPPDDPLGQGGPDLDMFLLKPPIKRVRSPPFYPSMPPLPRTSFPHNLHPVANSGWTGPHSHIQRPQTKVQRLQIHTRSPQESEKLRLSLIDCFPDNVSQIDRVLKNHCQERDVNKLMNYLINII